jgi:hypothetical protein
MRKIVSAGLVAAALSVALVAAAFGLAARVGPRRIAHGPAAAPNQTLRVDAGNLSAFVRSADASIHVVNARSGKTLAIAHLGDRITSLKFGPYGRYLYARVRDDRHLREIDTRTGKILVLGER